MARPTKEDLEDRDLRAVRVPETTWSDTAALEQVTALLYVLISDHLPASQINEVVRKARGLIGTKPFYADPRLEAWARELSLKVLR